MIKSTLIILTLLLFSACSFKLAPNDWHLKSISAFDSYTKNFLSANDSLAKSDLNRAINYAKQGADLKVLSRIYLAKCALNISVGVNDECAEYLEISTLVDDKASQAYFSFIQKKRVYDIEYLEKNYKDFASYVLNDDYAKAQKSIFGISKTTSKLLAAALIRDKLTKETRDEMLKISSYYGYKKSSLFWLNEKLVYEKDVIKRESIIKKIEILK